ncbi:MAG: hypothetical protein HOP19_02010 [Acidobacteria bacterium]|nr:hypothetical protein [Acidobacteriota bacterium]
MMNDEQISKKQWRAYLLGELEEVVVESLEERCFTEPDWHEALLAERDDLLDAWARQELTPAEAEKLEVRMADLPALQERAAFARSLHQHLSQSLSPALFTAGKTPT